MMTFELLLGTKILEITRVSCPFSKETIESVDLKGSSSTNFLYVIQLDFRILELLLKFPNTLSNPPKTVHKWKILRIFDAILVSIFPKYPVFWY